MEQSANKRPKKEIQCESRWDGRGGEEGRDLQDETGVTCKRLSSRGLTAQEGLHVLVPLAATLTHTEARTFAEVLARIVVEEQAEIATVARVVGARAGKVYVDFLQNGFGKTIAGPLSVRPRPGATVSAPLTWAEVNARLDPVRFTIRTLPKRLRTSGDALRGVLDAHTDVRAALHALSRRVR